MLSRDFQRSDDRRARRANGGAGVQDADVRQQRRWQDLRNYSAFSVSVKMKKSVSSVHSRPSAENPKKEG
jgi:hypothetical protein